MAGQKYFGIGGQAILEGIMMENGEYYAYVVQWEDDGIAVDKQRYVSPTDRYPLLCLPLVRGIFSFVDPMIFGMRVLNWSAEIYVSGDESAVEEESPKFEAFFEKILNEKAMKAMMGVIMAFSLLIAIGILTLLPVFLARLLKRIIVSGTLIAVLEGAFRISISICYIKVIPRMEDMHRTFIYHGAEHKRINCVEYGPPLTVENVVKSSRKHKHCGISSILIVMMILILFLIVIWPEVPLFRTVSRIPLMPVIAGASYEFLRFMDTHDPALVNVPSRPGMWMQGLTIRESTPSMAKVAIQAAEAVFDWKDHLRKNFDTVFPEDEVSA